MKILGSQREIKSKCNKFNNHHNNNKNNLKVLIKNIHLVMYLKNKNQRKKELEKKKKKMLVIMITHKKKMISLKMSKNDDFADIFILFLKKFYILVYKPKIFNNF